MLRGFLSHVLILVAASRAGANAIGANSYPSRPIRIVAPSTPGDAPDVIATLVAERLSSALGQQVFVENHPGAGGVVGSDIVANAAPDGYTLIIGNAGSHGINAAVYSRLPYDIQRDFAPICQIAIAPNIMVVNPELPGYETMAWFGILAPTATPRDIVNRLSLAIAKIARSPAM